MIFVIICWDEKKDTKGFLLSSEKYMLNLNFWEKKNGKNQIGNFFPPQKQPIIFFFIISY